jgi:hypothetical protein
MATHAEREEIRARIELNRKIREKAGQLPAPDRKKIPQKDPDKKTIPVCPPPPEVREKRRSLPPPTVSGKILVTAIDVGLIEKPRKPVFDEKHLNLAYEGLGLEILWSADRNIAYFFATTKVPFDEIGSRTHPLCLPGEVLRAKPSEVMADLFENSVGRLVRYGSTSLYFEKRREI